MNKMLLAAPVLLPIAGGMLLLASGLFKRGGVGGSRKLALYVEGLVLVNSLIIAWLLFHRPEDGGRMVLFRLYGNLIVMFKLDGMGSVFAALIAFLWPLATLYALEYMRKEQRKSEFFAYYTMTYGVTAGVALAGNLLTMYLFYEMLTLVTFPLVLYSMTKEAVRASRRYLYYSIGGAAFAFIGLVFVLRYSATGNTEFIAGGVLDLAMAQVDRNILLLIYVLAFFGFGVKAALLPCHGWLPRATVAPTPVTALLHAVAVVKSGAFAILRFTYFSFGTCFLFGTWAQWVVMGAALMTIAFGSTMAVREIHWKRRLAYSTISNLSYILFGAAMMTPLGLAAALSHMVAHAFMKICSFFCAGAVMHQSGKTYVYELDGLGRKMPVTFACLTVASFSLMGIPLFAGFISKWNLAQAAFGCGGSAAAYGAAQTAGAVGSSSMGWLPYAGVGVILYSALMTGIYMLTVLIRAYFPKILPQAAVVERDGLQGGSGIGANAASGDPVGGAGRPVTDPNWMMLVPLITFAVVILVIGLHSAPLMEYLTAIGGEAG